MGSSGSQNVEATWRFLVPTMIDPRRRKHLLRWSWEAFMLRQDGAKTYKTHVFRVLRIESSEISLRRRDRRSHLPNFGSCTLFKAMGTPGCWEPLAVGDDRSRRSTDWKQRGTEKDLIFTASIAHSVLKIWLEFQVFRWLTIGCKDSIAAYIRFGLYTKALCNYFDLPMVCRLLIGLKI